MNSSVLNSPEHFQAALSVYIDCTAIVHNHGYILSLIRACRSIFHGQFVVQYYMHCTPSTIVIDIYQVDNLGWSIGCFLSNSFGILFFIKTDGMI